MKRLWTIALAVSLTLAGGPAAAADPCSNTSGSTKASHYGYNYRGKKLHTAHRLFKFGTKIRVIYGKKKDGNANFVTVTVGDRGPYVKGRCLDLSKSAFAALAPPSRGVLTVRYKVVGT